MHQGMHPGHASEKAGFKGRTLRKSQRKKSYVFSPQGSAYEFIAKDVNL